MASVGLVRFTRWTFHDATLVAITLDWGSGHLTMELLTATGSTAIRASGVSGVEMPCRQPWGHFPGTGGGAPPTGFSSSINQVRLGHQRLEVEMQSGDRIVVEAQELEVP